MKRLALAAALLLVFLVVGCKKKDSYEGARSMSSSAQSAPSAGSPAPAAAVRGEENIESRTALSAQAVRPKIIMTAEAFIRSEDLVGDLRIIKTKIQDLGGYVAASTQDARDKLNRTARLTIKIPSDKFDPMMEFLESRFTVESVKTDSQDVGEEYVDIESRVANLRMEEQSLVKLLDTRSGKLADVLTVEREVARVRGEIEKMQGRLRYLDNRVGYSVIELKLDQSKPVQEVKVSWVAKTGREVKESLLTSVMVLGTSVKVVLVIIAAVLPFAVVIGLAATIVILIRKLARSRPKQ